MKHLKEMHIAVGAEVFLTSDASCGHFFRRFLIAALRQSLELGGPRFYFAPAERTVLFP